MQTDALNISIAEYRKNMDDREPPNDLQKQEREYSWQVRRYSVIESIILAFLAVIVIMILSYLLTTTITTRTEILLYIISMAIVPSGVFLFLLHLYEMYMIYTKGKKLIPLLLDLCYLFCVPFFTITIFSLDALYSRYHLPSKFLTSGWTTAVFLLFLEIAVAYLVAHVVVKRIISPRFPLLFPATLSTNRKPMVLPMRGKKPTKQVFYFRKKPDQSIWEHDTCFVQYQR